MRQHLNKEDKFKNIYIFLNFEIYDFTVFSVDKYMCREVKLSIDECVLMKCCFLIAFLSGFYWVLIELEFY